jgi:hypothetical protein
MKKLPVVVRETGPEAGDLSGSEEEYGIALWNEEITGCCKRSE